MSKYTPTKMEDNLASAIKEAAMAGWKDSEAKDFLFKNARKVLVKYLGEAAAEHYHLQFVREEGIVL